VSDYLRNLIPGTNRIEANQARGTGRKSSFLATCYSDGGFVGSFMPRGRADVPGSSDGGWAQDAGDYLRDEWTAEAEGPKFLSDVLSSLPNAADGGCHMSHVAAYEAWAAAGKVGVEPFTCEQDYGSCVDASLSELLTAMLGLRIEAGKPEKWVTSAAWYAYALRGYCSDGWNAWGAATALQKLGAGFRGRYDFDGQDSIDMTDDDRNEQLCARTWCRNGPPSYLRQHTTANHPVNQAAIVEFDGGLHELMTAFANRGVLHFSGTRVSGGPKPFTPGSVGPHQMPAYGCDSSEEGRKWFRDRCGVAIADNDCAVHCGNTWGTRTGQWSGECSDQYWPPHWGPKTPGSWICLGSWFMRNLSQDMVYFPDVIPGFPGTPVPPPTPVQPKLEGTLYAEQVGSIIAIRGELKLEDKHAYIVVPDGTGTFKPIPKPIV
jgi:hypothetical protein